MSFLAPLFLLGAAAISLPLLLHLLRRRVVRTVPFPALRFLAATRADQRHQNLRRRLVLALRCLALLLLAAAFARPFLGAPPNTQGRATVVVIDNSYSLQAADRWPALLRWTRDQLGTPAPGDTLGLLLMNPRPTWLVSPTQDTEKALRTLLDLKPGWHATRAEPALRLAADILAAAPARERRLVFLGDHQALGWTGADFAKKLPPGVTAQFPPPRPPLTSQAALTAATLQREGDRWTLAVAARSFAGRHARTLSVYAENSASALATAPLPENTTDTVRIQLPVTFEPPAWLRVSLDPDQLPADDTLYVPTPSVRAADRLLLLDRTPLSAGEADYVATAYEALAKIPPAVRLAPYPGALGTPKLIEGGGGLAILRHDTSFTAEAAARLDTFLKAGGSAFVLLDGGPAQLRWLASHGITPRPIDAKLARVRDWTLDHPLIAPLAETSLRSLVGWTFARGYALPADVLDPVAFWTDGSVALGEMRIGNGRLLLAGFRADRRDGDWPVQTAFVPFLHRSAAFLLGATSAAESPARVGAPLALPDLPGIFRPLAGPALSSQPSALSSSVPSAPGVYEFTSPGTPRRLYAVGLPTEESDLSPWTAGTPWTQLVSTEKPAERPLARVAAAEADAERQNPLWWWAFAAMGLFALSELALANRTTR